MKGSSNIIEEISLSSPPESKESYVKQKTRAKFQQLIKSSSLLSSQQSSESVEQVEETALIIKPAPQTSTEKNTHIDGSTNMGFAHEDDKVAVFEQSDSDKIFEISSLDDPDSVQRNTIPKDESNHSHFVQPVPRRRKSKSQQMEGTFAMEQKLSVPKPTPQKISVSRNVPKPHNSSQYEQPIYFDSEQSELSLSSNVQTSFDDSWQKGDGSDIQNAHLVVASTRINKTLSEISKDTEGPWSGDSIHQDGSSDNLQRKASHSTNIKTKDLHQKKNANTEKKQKQKSMVELSLEHTSLDNRVSTKENIISNDHLPEGERVLGVYIHHCDRLRTELMASHPLVRVHIIDASKGTYLKKSNIERAVTSFYETQRKDVDFIIPVMTQPSTYIEKKLAYPSWEELLVFNEDFSYFIQEGVNAILFFEVLDFFKALPGGKKYHRLHNQNGWQKISWAFLKLVGSNNIVNTGKKLRLQLYKVPNIKKNRKSSTVDVYNWWSQKSKIPMQTSLYVSVEPIALIEVEPAMRSMLPMQAEKGRTTLDELTKSLDNGVALSSPKSASSCSDPSGSETSLNYQWTRLPEQPCEIPNFQMQSLGTNDCPCYSLKFSHNGRALAAGCGAREQHYLIIYEIPSGNVLCQQTVHTGIMYDLEWFPDDKWLLSASADCTARLWNAGSWSCVAVLPHPTFVYCSKFQLPFFNSIATGSYDHVVRFWVMTSDSSVHLLREFEGHHSHINSLCWNETGSLLYSADNVGGIKAWNTDHYGKVPNKDTCQSWSLEREYGLPEVKGVPINSIDLVADERMLLLYCRDSVIRLFDMSKNKVIQRYSGSLNCQNLLRGSTSPCGNLVFFGGEDGKVYVWDFHSGTNIAIYSNLPYNEPVLCVDYHPHDHIIAICSLEASTPILLYKYDETAPLIQESAAVVRPESSSSTKMKDSGCKSNHYDMYSTSDASSLDKRLSSGKDKRNLFPKPKHTLDENSKSSTSEIPSQSKSPILKSPHEVKFISSKPEERSSTSWGSKFNKTSAEYVALYHYKPQRADEIALKKGDKVSVIKFETDNWWIGSVGNGKQGYFPSNYVTPNSDNQEVYSGADDIYEDTPQALTAVITTSGKFEIISGPEESDELIHLSPRKKRLAKKKKAILDDNHQSQAPPMQSSKRNHRRNLLKSLQEKR